ncbi:MAG: bactofilin family protein [Brevinema sp.]
MSKEFTSNSLIGEGAVFEGKFTVAGSFRIDGQFEGELTVEDHLFISPVGRLKTDTVYTKTITVAGIFIGNIEASEEVQLLSTGRVLGNIKSPKLVMEPGVVVQGQIDITGSQGVVNIKESFTNNQEVANKKLSKKDEKKDESLSYSEE